MKYDKYISTTLPYANSVPHIGHALEFIQADALVHYFKGVAKENVFFNIGIDENGLKVYTKAKELGIDTQAYLDSLALDWIEFCKKFEIESDNFYRTTRISHHGMVQRFWTKCLERGDLYKKPYSGLYCVGCESFKTEADLIPGYRYCPDHNTVPIVIEEENWFFKVSKYKGLVYGWLQANKDVLIPQSKLTELENIILQSDDISVSRLKKNVPWGVTVPGDEDQVIYVWFEALLNYIFAVEDFDAQYFIQLCGPDNLRFQGSLLQAILASSNHKHTSKLLVHGTVVDASGKKMSKSMGNVVDPMEQLQKYGLDAVRYYTLAGLPTYKNASWSESDLVKKYNSELADDYGNLLARVLHLIDTKNVEITGPEFEFEHAVEVLVKNAKYHWQEYDINMAVNETNVLLKMGNKYINDTKPWEKDKNYQQILNNLYFLLCETNKLYLPVLSAKTYQLIEEALVLKKKVIIFPKL